MTVRERSTAPLSRRTSAKPPGSVAGVSAATRPGAGAAGGLGFALQLIGGTFR